ncbi:ascorbate transporter, chloroplastic [Olea europaea subsp. europaea]|uniref:Ascorbate transporter, chloroplastic n=1 Tax=Olea europaea subsp. europaea TaxID=158383 RepID=A0A8S0QX71_OLEEU|nr:ascorbate transporter, chloroplastic [Olea europaea subsp. europaea]
MQSSGFLGPAFFLIQLKQVKTPTLAVRCMACSQGVLLALSNTAGVLAGVLCTVTTGYILQKGSWDDVFKVAVVLYIIGTLVWNFFSTREKILE